MTLDLRVEVRFKNNVLWRALTERFETVTFAGKVIGINQLHLYGFLSLRLSPWSRVTGHPTSLAERISTALEIDAETLFPRHLYNSGQPNMITREIDSSRYLSLNEARAAHLLPASTEDEPEFELAIDNAETRERIREVLTTLTSRRAQVLTLRFGLDGKGERTLGEVAATLAVTRERIRQIERRALRDLRHPTRARYLLTGRNRDALDLLRKIRQRRMVPWPHGDR
jgi:hypothetical protein